MAGEHLVSATVQRRIAAAFDSAERHPDGPTVVVGLARGSRHELGVLAFATALRRAGLDVVYVGGDLPPDGWAAVVADRNPAAVVIGVPSAEDVPAVRETIAVLAATRPDLPVHVGGGHQRRLEEAQPARPRARPRRRAAGRRADPGRLSRAGSGRAVRRGTVRPCDPPPPCCSACSP